MSSTPAIEIRPLEPDDEAAVVELSPRLTVGVAEWREPSKVESAARAWIEASPATAQEPGHGVFVAVTDNKIIGVVTLTQRKHFSGDLDAYIGELITARGMEGRGVGRQLLAAAERWAHEHGLKHITLETGAANSRARNFYQLAGYEEEDIRLTKPVGTRPDRAHPLTRTTPS